MKKILTIIVAFLFFIIGHAQTMTCKDLVKYRDVNLLAILDNETAKAKQMQQNLMASKLEIEKQKKILEKAKTNAEVKMAITAIKGAADQVISIFSAIKAAKGGLKIAVNAANVAAAISKGKGRLDVLIADSEKDALVKAIENEVIGAIPIVSNIYSLYGTIDDLSKLNKVRYDLLNDISKANANIDKVNAKLSSAFIGVKRVNDYQYYISDYLNKNCSAK